MGSDSTNNLMAQKGHALQIMHIPTGKIVEFKAFLTDFTDSYNSNWQKTPVYGRMDDIATFQGTSRQINVSWNVPAFSNEDAKLNLQKASLLFSMLYPTYEASANMGGAGQISAAPLLRMKFANLICSMTNGNFAGGVETAGLVGYVEGGVVLTPDFLGGFYDPGFGEIYPMNFSLSLTYNVLHTHKLGWESGASQGSTRLNGNADGTSPQFPYGSSFPPRSSNVVNNLGESDASESADADTQATSTDTFAGTAQGEMEAIQNAMDEASGYINEFGQSMPAGAAGSPVNPTSVINAAMQAMIMGGNISPNFQDTGNPPAGNS